jgi:hypothetical protein
VAAVFGGRIKGAYEHGPFAGWRATGVAAAGADGKPRLLWKHKDGLASVWALSSVAALESGVEYGPFGTGSRTGSGGDSSGAGGRCRWMRPPAPAVAAPDRRVSLWKLSPRGQFQAGQEFYPEAAS